MNPLSSNRSLGGSAAGRPVATQTLPIHEGRLADFSSDVLGSLQRLHAQFGPIAALKEGALQVVFLFDPALNHQVLSNTKSYHARFFAIRGPKRSAQRRVTCGLLGMNGEQHRRNRRVVKEAFSLKTITGYRSTIEQLTDQLLDSWQPGETIDLAEEMTRFMLQVTSSLLFGLEDLEAAYRLGEQIADWVSLMHDIGAGALVPDVAFAERYEELLATGEELEQSVQGMIDYRRSQAGQGRDVLSLLLRGHEEEGQLSDEELVGQSCVLFGAAHMTTAHSFMWTLLLLAQHPQEMLSLWEEIETLPDGEQPQLDRVIKESMRLLPASAYSQRVTSEAVQLGPFDLPRGTPIVFTPFITHRLESLYEEPKRFLPDRWARLNRSPYEYLPFGAGSRMCIGGPLALEILRTALPRMLRRFRMQIPEGAAIDAQIRGTMLAPVGPCPVTLSTAEGECASSVLSGNLPELVDFSGPESVRFRPRQPR